MKSMIGISLFVALMAACNQGNHIWGTGEDFRHVEFSHILSDSTITADSLAVEMGGNIKAHAENVMPKTGVAYIEQETGDRWTITLSDSPDSIGYGKAYYEQRSGSAISLQTQLKLRGHGFFLIDELTGRRWYGDSGLLYVYASCDSIGITDGVSRRIFVTADVLPTPNDSLHKPKCSSAVKGQAHSQWIKEGKELVYVDASGCIMKNNWTHDGFYVDGEGRWDPYTPSLEKDLLADGFYTCRNWGSWEGKQMTFKLTTDADGIRRGTAVLSIRVVKDQEVLENYIVTATGNSTYLLVKADNDTLRYHATIFDEGIPGKGRQMLLSGYGKTECYE